MNCCLSDVAHVPPLLLCLVHAHRLSAHFTLAPVCGGHGGACPGEFDVMQPESTKPLWYITARKSLSTYS